MQYYKKYNNTSIVLILLFGISGLLAIPNNCFAQELDEAQAKEKKKVNLIFRLDYGFKNPLSLKTNYLYNGEYLADNNNEWIWLEEERSAFPLDSLPGHSLTQTNIKFDLMISLNEQLNIGLSYNAVPYLETIGYDPPIPNVWEQRQYYFFFAIAGVVDYNYELPMVKNLIINPAISIGSHQNEYLYGATGRNFYYDARLAVAYRLFKRLDIRLWSSYTHFMYREKKTSEIYPDRDRVAKIDIRSINAGFGLAYRFFIFPD